MLDSAADLAATTVALRGVLDDSGFKSTRIIVATPANEGAIAALMATAAPAHAFYVTSGLALTGPDSPANCATYELVELADADGKLLSREPADKAGWPGSKQVMRSYDAEGMIEQDVIALADEDLPGTPMLHAVLERDRIVYDKPGLESIRVHSASMLKTVPPAVLLGHDTEDRVSHSAGLSGFDSPTPEDLYDWDDIFGRLTAQAPWWEPGSKSQTDID